MYFSIKTKVFCALCIFILISCKSNKSQSDSVKSKGGVVSYVDSLSATKAIVEEDSDGFFDQISIIDMAIQMKSEKDYKSREEALIEYKAYLRTEVMNWTDSEKILLNEIFDSIKIQVQRVNPDLMPEDIRLVKIRTNHYGPDVYYTRGKNIMIPENALNRQGAREMLEPVMIHETFHIISRYDKALKEKIYALIGFFPHNQTLNVPKAITDRWLTNPDGISTDYYIQLRDEKLEAKAIPLILSNKSAFTTTNPSFFSYLQFDLFELDEDSGQLLHGDNLATTLTDGMMPGFFEQIKDNTQYIIHPDEIAADNFIYAVTRSNITDSKRFSDEGADLVERIYKVLQEN